MLINMPANMICKSNGCENEELTWKNGISIVVAFCQGIAVDLEFDMFTEHYIALGNRA